MTTYALQPLNFQELHDAKNHQEKAVTKIIQNRVFWTRRWLETQNGFWTMYNRVGGGVGKVQMTDILENKIKAIWYEIKKSQGVGIENKVDIKEAISNEVSSLLTDLSWTKKNGLEKHGFQKMVCVILRIYQDGFVL